MSKRLELCHQLQMSQRGYRLVRYADDFVILCDTQAEAQARLSRYRHGCKCKDCSFTRRRPASATAGFPDRVLTFWDIGSKPVDATSGTRACGRFKDRVREQTRRSGGKSLMQVIEVLNPMLRGWFGYFKHARSYTFKSLDGFIRRRLRSILRSHQHRAGRGITRADHQLSLLSVVYSP